MGQQGHDAALIFGPGTLSVPDVLTDLGAEEVDLFMGGKAWYPCGWEVVRNLGTFCCPRLTRTCCRAPATYFE